jgi:SAM-dependent methyltransferase
MTALHARAAYRLWAPVYAAETAISYLDELLAKQMLSGVSSERLLDAGCGTGRRISELANAIGVDASPEMVAAGGGARMVVADVRDLPFPAESFDMVWCRLVLGHLADPLPAYKELKRVCRRDRYIFITDFHPHAVEAGGRRTFRDQTGQLHEVEHYVHAHAILAQQAGLALVNRQDAGVGPAIRDFYDRAGKSMQYEKDMGLKLVDAFLFRRTD